MSVHVHLDRPHSLFNNFTNLDFITGRVTLDLPNNETISSILVKLEGESKTRLAVSQLPLDQQLALGPRGRRHAELESHKLLYKVLVVFPAEQLQKTAPENASYTLPAGQSEYPFRFKIPMNNDCHANAAFTNSNVAGLLGEIARATNKHVKTTLPPSLDGIHDQAEICYFVKATVQRPAFYKENFRGYQKFTFVPIEPPRDPDNRRESFARRQHHFAPKLDVPSKKSPFGRSSVSSPSVVPPNFALDSRLPDPAIITCNEPLPLRILVSKLNETSATIYLQLLNIELVGYTTTRAHQLQKSDSASWVIMSVSNMRMPLTNNEKYGSTNDLEIDAKLWNQIPIPSTVAPSFSACNITRTYSLDIKVGLSYGSSNEIFPELTVQSLHMPLKVYSGIAPPPEIISRMSYQWPTQGQAQPLSSQPQPFTQTPSSRPPQQFHPPLQHVQPGHTASMPNPSPEDAPPSYEDVIADNIRPVDGLRGDHPPDNHQQPGRPSTTENSSEKSGKDERLFPDSDQPYQ